MRTEGQRHTARDRSSRKPNKKMELRVHLLQRNFHWKK